MCVCVCARARACACVRACDARISHGWHSEVVRAVRKLRQFPFIMLCSLFVQLMHTNYYKIVKQLKSFKIIIVASTCFGLHKPSSGSYQPVLR